MLSRQLPFGGVVVLAGMGGVGKSTVSLEFARRCLARRFLGRIGSREVWYVSGANTESLIAGLATVARRLGGNQADLEAIESQRPDAPDRLWRLLGRSPHRWLLLIDNADDPRLLAAPVPPAAPAARATSRVADGTGWVRDGRRGLIVLSSRHGDQDTWGRRTIVRQLRSLDDIEAGQVLRDLAPRGGDHAQAEALGRRLGGLPLALHLAGLHVGSRITRWDSFEAFREALDRDPTAIRILSTDSDTDLARDERALVMRTWELSLDALAEHGLPQARALLRLLSCYAPALPIPRAVLAPELLAPLLRAGQEDTLANEPAPEEVLRSLARLGLIDSPEGRTVVVHPVVAATNRAHLTAPRIPPDPEPSLVRETAVALVAGALRDLDPERPENWARFQELTPHLLALLTATAAYLDDDLATTLVETATRTADAYHWSGVIPSAMTVTKAAHALGQRLGDDHPAILDLRSALAFETGMQGRWREAERAYREIVETMRHVLGADHRSTLNAQHNLARTEIEQGRWAEAEAIYLEVLEARQRVLGPVHPATFSSRMHIAWAATEQGRWAEAEAIYVEVLEARQRVLGPDHLQTLESRYYVAWAAAEQERWAEAEPCLRDVLKDRRRILGADHPATLDTQRELARVAAGQRRWKDADATYRTVIEAERRVLGADHPLTLNACHEFAEVAARRGEASRGAGDLPRGPGGKAAHAGLPPRYDQHPSGAWRPGRPIERG